MTPRAPAPMLLASLRAEVAARATVDALAELGTITRAELEEYSRRAHELVVDYLVGNWSGVDAAFRFAAAIDADAELAWHLGAS